MQYKKRRGRIARKFQRRRRRIFKSSTDRKFLAENATRVGRWKSVGSFKFPRRGGKWGEGEKRETHDKHYNTLAGEQTRVGMLAGALGGGSDTSLLSAPFEPTQAAAHFHIKRMKHDCPLSSSSLMVNTITPLVAKIRLSIYVRCNYCKCNTMPFLPYSELFTFLACCGNIVQTKIINQNYNLQ